MSIKDLRAILSDLEEELANTELDEESRQLLTDLNAQIDSALDDSEYSMSPMMETATMLEARFAADHPTGEKLFRALMDTMVKMGI